MTLYKFKGPHHIALTVDKTGSNLPTQYGPWVYVKQLVVTANSKPLVGATNAQIIAAIQKNGYIILPPVAKKSAAKKKTKP